MLTESQHQVNLRQFVGQVVFGVIYDGRVGLRRFPDVDFPVGRRVGADILHVPLAIFAGDDG